MWLFFVIGAMIALGLNLLFYMTNRNSAIFRFISISMSAMSVCCFYAQNKEWVLNEDWSALMDVVPTTSTLLWVFVVLTILMNSISFIKRK